MGTDVPTALYAANMLSGILSQQQHIGVLVAWQSGLQNVEAFTAEVMYASHITQSN